MLVGMKAKSEDLLPEETDNIQTIHDNIQTIQIWELTENYYIKGSQPIQVFEIDCQHFELSELFMYLEIFLFEIVLLGSSFGCCLSLGQSSL